MKSGSRHMTGRKSFRPGHAISHIADQARGRQCAHLIGHLTFLEYFSPEGLASAGTCQENKMIFGKQPGAASCVSLTWRQLKS